MYPVLNFLACLLAGEASVQLRGQLPLETGAPALLHLGVGAAWILLAGRKAVLPAGFASALINARMMLQPGITAGAAVPAAALMAAGDLLAMAGAAELTRRLARGADAFEQPQTVSIFLAIAAGCAAAGATAHLAGLALLPGDPIARALSTWAGTSLAGFLPLLIVTPLIVVFSRPATYVPRPGRGELAGLVMVLAGMAVLIFPGWGMPTQGMPLAFLTLPIPLWPAFRFGLRGTAAVTLAIAVIATASTLSGRGPFAVGGEATAVLLVQNYAGVMAVTGLVLAAAINHRRLITGQMRASEQRYRALFESNPLPAWVFDVQTLRFLAVNEAAVGHYGYSREEFLRMTTEDLRPQEGPPQAETSSLANAPSGHLKGTWRHRRKDGSVIQCELVRHNLTFDGREAALVLVIDVTERNRTQARLAAFSELGRKLGAARTAREAARILATAADQLFGWDACLLVMRGPEGRVDPVFCMDTIEGRRTECVPPTGQLGSLVRRTLEHGAQLIVRSPADIRTVIEGDGAQGVLRFGDETRPSASLMFVPVRQEPENAGVFSVQSYRPDAYSPENLDTLQALVDHCSGALERIRAQGSLQAELAERQKAQREILRLNAELEGRVRDRTAQLQAANRELEAFAYSVSHDLRAPLRSIRGFADVLLERYSERLDDRGRDFLRRTCESSNHMDRLIEDLLKFSRVSRSELHRLPVDLSAIAESIAADLQKAEPQRKVDFRIRPELLASGDERLLRVVLDNLLRNAWKFTTREAEARIEFGRVTEPKPAFFVRDNGAGFDMQYAKRLFGVFQRLHSAAEFPGTGIGLATVQRIILRHGGRVWAQSAPNEGATFFFTLPPGPEVSPTGPDPSQPVSDASHPL